MRRCAFGALVAGLLGLGAPAFSQSPGETFRDPLASGAQGPELVVVPAGSYEMGAPPGEGASWLAGVDQPRHRVRIAKPFAIGRYEVTRGEYAAFAEAAGRPTVASCANVYEDVFAAINSWESPGFEQTDLDPVVCITRADAQAYLAWLTQETGFRYRLPSEAEWEYAARAGSTTAYVNGDDVTGICAAANVWDRSMKALSSWATTDCDDGFVYTAPVGSFAPNALGLHDVIGNAEEMTEDCWFDDHRRAPEDGSARTKEECSEFVTRGGSWGTEGPYLRTAHRTFEYFPEWDIEAGQDMRQGFRVVRELP